MTSPGGRVCAMPILDKNVYSRRFLLLSQRLKVDKEFLSRDFESTRDSSGLANFQLKKKKKKSREDGFLVM